MVTFPLIFTLMSLKWFRYKPLEQVFLLLLGLFFFIMETVTDLTIETLVTNKINTAREALCY